MGLSATGAAATTQTHRGPVFKEPGLIFLPKDMTHFPFFFPFYFRQEPHPDHEHTHPNCVQPERFSSGLVPSTDKSASHWALFSIRFYFPGFILLMFSSLGFTSLPIYAAVPPLRLDLAPSLFSPFSPNHSFISHVTAGTSPCTQIKLTHSSLTTVPGTGGRWVTGEDVGRANL